MSEPPKKRRRYKQYRRKKAIQAAQGGADPLRRFFFLRLRDKLTGQGKKIPRRKYAASPQKLVLPLPGTGIRLQYKYFISFFLKNPPTN
jgi:hypothetical protein